MRGLAILLVAALLAFGQRGTVTAPGGGALPTGASNCVVASPANGSSGTVACRGMATADIALVSPPNGVNAKAYGAKGDGVVATDGAMAAATTFTFTCSAQCYPSAVLLEYSGASLDVSAQQGGQGTTFTAPSVTTTAANDRLITVFAFGGANTFVAPGVPTQRSLVGWDGSNIGHYSGDQTIVAAGATGTVTATIGSSVGFTGISIALKPSTAIGFVGATNANVDNGSAISLTDVGASAVGNLQIACIAYYSAATLTGIPSGFTLIQTATGTANGVRTSCYQHTVAAINAGSILTSASATFTGGDAGKLLCVDGAGASSVELCGTILSFIDSHDIGLSFVNVNSGITAQEFAYATNDDAAMASAVAAACGSILFVPPGVYGLSVEIDPCSTKAFTLLGSGAGVTDYNNNGTVTTGATPACLLFFLTKGMTGAGVHFGNGITTFAQEVAAYRHAYVIENIGIQAGLGNKHKDGGGPAVKGVYLDHISRVVMESVFISGFGGDGINLNSSWAAIIRNGLVNQVGGNGLYAAGGGQNLQVEGTEFSSNALAGIDIASTFPTTLLNDIAQWNNYNNPTGYQIAVENSTLLTVEGAWFEPGGGAQPTINAIQPAVGVREFNNNSSGTYHVSFATAAAVVNGLQWYCADCQPTTDPTNMTIATGGTGCPVIGVNGAWKCLSY